MTHIFYMLLFIPLLLEFVVISDPKETLARNLEMKRLNKEGVLLQDWPDELAGYVVIGVFYWILAFAGLLTFQWYLFVALIAISLIPKRNETMVVLDGILSAGLILLIILNKYHNLI